ncbi:hypothetical protein BDY24DRAFT_378408 [Mrakia frigida]|uniref:DUF6534 domain-containing protein n=1 Tax=Mrakia frigida TaxID=29902 RepID=UPI003FCBFA11
MNDTSEDTRGLSVAALEYAMSPGRYLGPILVASLIDHMLFGVLAVYAFTYWRFFQDTAKFKILVTSLFVINLAQTILVFYTVYTIFGTGFGIWEGALTNVYFEGVMMLEAMAGALSQAFFLERAFTLLRRHRTLGWILLAFCVPSILAGLAMGLGSGVTTVLQASVDTNFDNFDILKNFIISWKSITVFTDLILTSTIVACLFSSRTGRSSTDVMISRVICWIIEAQTLPLMAALFFLASYAVDSGANLCIVPSFVEGKLCALSVLHVLNSRGRLRHQVSSLNDTSRNPKTTQPKDTITVSTITHTRYSPAAELDLEAQPEKTESLQSHNLECISENVSLHEFDPPSTPIPDFEMSSSRRGRSSPLERSRLEIDMIDQTREPMGEIRTHSMTRAVVPFEEMKW